MRESKTTKSVDVPASISDAVYTKKMDELIEYVASYQYQTGVDPSVGAALEHVAEMCRRIWNDRAPR